MAVTCLEFLAGGAIAITAYVRHGACKMCGKCCTYNISARRQETLPEDGHGKWYKISDAPEYWYELFVGKKEFGSCQALSADGKCFLHHSEVRSELCKLWPFGPECIEPYPDCGYSFEEMV